MASASKADPVPRPKPTRRQRGRNTRAGEEPPSPRVLTSPTASTNHRREPSSIQGIARGYIISSAAATVLAIAAIWLFQEDQTIAAVVSAGIGTYTALTWIDAMPEAWPWRNGASSWSSKPGATSGAK